MVPKTKAQNRFYGIKQMPQTNGLNIIALLGSRLNTVRMMLLHPSKRLG